MTLLAALPLGVGLATIAMILSGLSSTIIIFICALLSLASSVAILAGLRRRPSAEVSSIAAEEKEEMPVMFREEREEQENKEPQTAEPVVSAQKPAAPVTLVGLSPEYEERRLHHAQKMDALSRLTGGIAHDLNNRLTVISANIDAVAKQMKDQPQLKRKLLSALVAVDRATALMSKLLAFARQREWRPQFLDPAEQLVSIAELLNRSLLSEAVGVKVHCSENLWTIEVDPDQLQTAVVNLAINARDAMPRGGTIDIEASNVTLRGSDKGLHGDFVCISVSDTGIGISSEHLEEVFEPFFTTKEVSRGSGLGLSQVQGLLMQLGGEVALESEVGVGTSVSLYIPRAQMPTRVGTPRSLTNDISDTKPERKKLHAEILIIDDEVDVALALESMISELGYPTRIAIGANEALDCINTTLPDLVLTDVTMPGTMDGIALGRQIRHRFPQLPIILITSNPTVVADDTDFSLLSKPINSKDLDTALRYHLVANKSLVVKFPGRSA